MLHVTAVHDNDALKMGQRGKLVAVSATRTICQGLATEEAGRFLLAYLVEGEGDLNGQRAEGQQHLHLTLDNLESWMARTLVSRVHTEEKWDISFLCVLLTRIKEMRRVLQELQEVHHVAASPQSQRTHSAENTGRAHFVRTFLHLLYENSLVSSALRESQLKRCLEDIEGSPVVAVDVLRHLRNLLHHDHDKVTSGLVHVKRDLVHVKRDLVHVKMRHLRNLLHHDHDKVTSGLVAVQST